MPVLAHLFDASQTASQGTVGVMVDGLGSASALKLVRAGFRAELVATLRLRMAARIVQATRLKRATRELVQVRVVAVHHLRRLVYCSSHSM